MSLDDFDAAASDKPVVPPSRFTRRQFVAATGGVATAALVGPSLARATSSRGDSQTLTWLAWSGQSDKEFLGPFEKKYGATVKAKEYSGDDEMLALATTAPPGTFDVVHADAEYVSLLRKAGLLMPLNLADFPEVKSFFPEFGPVGSRHYFPSLWDKSHPYAFVLRFGLLELAYNTKYVKPQDAESYKVLWSPKVKGKVGWFDWWSHMGTIGLYVGNKDPYNVNTAKFNKMVRAVDTLKPQTAGFYSIADLFNVFSNEEIYIEPSGGDWTALLLQQQGHPIAASTPKEGAVQWTETLGIFKSARNPELAKEFVRYALSAEGQVRSALLPAYQAVVPSKAGWQLMNKEHPQWATRLKMKLKGPNVLDQYKANRISIRKIPVQQPIKTWASAWTQFKNS
jgi:spermidine/putrescine transport system substrate-binding protein